MDPAPACERRKVQKDQIWHQKQYIVVLDFASLAGSVQLYVFFWEMLVIRGKQERCDNEPSHYAHDNITYDLDYAHVPVEPFRLNEATANGWWFLEFLNQFLFLIWFTPAFGGKGIKWGQGPYALKLVHWYHFFML